MKTMFNKTIILSFGLVLILSLFSCNNISLGDRLDLLGPVVEITAPAPRKAVSSQFSLEGTAKDASGVELILIKAVIDNNEYQRQWRYYQGTWYISDNKGEDWAQYTAATWEGDYKNGIWSVIIEMQIGSITPKNGEYTFVVQAWDMGGFSDDNSFKTIVLIYDSEPPLVEITDPYIYREGYSFWDQFEKLDAIPDSSDEWMEPVNIGKFITRGFNLEWQITDNHDIRSIDIRLYDAKDPLIIIDEDPETPLPEGALFYHRENLPEPDPSIDIGPNGRVFVELDGVTEKTTIMVVASCYDASGNRNEERILGYFVYWPKADNPWIIFPQGMKESYDNEDEYYLAYPGREIKPTAYQAKGVLRVEYEIYKLSAWDGDKVGDIVLSGTKNNPERFAGVYSNIFPWEFEPPLSTGYYLIEAEVFCKGTSSEEKSEIYKASFFVQDTSFPDFPEPPSPSASLPFYRAIGVADSFGKATSANSIRIHGTVSDATEVTSLYLVWINPESVGYAQMSQLSYFRDPNYEGWQYGKDAPLGGFSEEGLKDTTHKNKVWNLELTPPEMNYETDRWVRKYSQEINLTDHLNIAADKQPLKSQTFILKVQNRDNKNTIIIYAPQGDESPPIIKIDNVHISRQNINCEPERYQLIEQFEDGDVITIDGTWIEDSIEYLDFETYFRNNFEVKINNYVITHLRLPEQPNVSMSFTPSTGKVPGGTGGWQVIATVGTGSSYYVQTSMMKDNLVVSAKVFDIGKNPDEVQGSWLIKSDTLRLLRISSEDADKKYNSPNTIKIFMEFNKPVGLKSGRSANPQLELNISGTGVTSAAYQSNPIQSTRQYFTYVVGADHKHTGTDTYLDVRGLVGLGGGNYWEAANYTFTWISGTEGGTDTEEIRVTMNAAHTAGTGSANLYYHRLPVKDNAEDEPYTLMRSKKIEIDTEPPTVTGVSSTNPLGYYPKASIISIDVTFSENVRIEGAVPQLQLQGLGSTTGTPKVNGNKITFSYIVGPDNTDTTNGSDIVITGITNIGSIQDFAGNPLNTLGGDKTLTGIRVETVAPGAPILKLKTAAANIHGDNSTNVVSNNVSGTVVTGVSQTSSVVNLTNVYNNELWIAIDGNIERYADQLNALEYSVKNGDPGTWIRAPGPYTGNYYVLELGNVGQYHIKTRQIDSAGNPSAESQTVSFYWDPGDIVTRITSTSSNGTYTANAGKNTINITVHFRKPLYFTNTPSLTLNARNSGGTNISVSADPGQTGSQVSSLGYTYTVQAGHNINSNPAAILDVTNISTSFTARDGTSSTNGVNVASLFAIPAAGANNRLGENKQIKIDTSSFSVSGAPVFTGSIQTDGTWSGTMTMTFNQNIVRGTGDITIIQYTENTASDRYRIPAVMTEAQYNRYRTLEGINTYYTRGTNGYNYVSASDRGADTSAKYVLSYEHDTANINPVAGTGIAGFAEALRQAEAVKLSIQSTQSVGISGQTLTVQLTGSNALQVAGARYTVSFPAGFVQDALGNQIAAYSNTPTVTISGVAKPSVRVRKSQDIITRSNTINDSTPRFNSSQPLTTEVRFDCRTPNATVYYTTTQAETSTTSDNWSWNGTPGDTNTPAAPNQPGTPTNTSSTTNPVTIGGTTGGTTTTINNVQGLQWFARARALKSGTWSSDSYEMAFRTVLTYVADIAAINSETQQSPQNGDQIWIRGGDDISISSTPGFPLTWEEDWPNLDGKRAGIRLMQKIGTSALRTSTYRFVSWEINTTAYVDFILGRDETAENLADIVWQYGPRQWAYQRAGWTSFKDRYPVYPGKHRYMTTNDNPGKGALNFSATMQPRPQFTANSGWSAPNTVTATPSH